MFAWSTPRFTVNGAPDCARNTLLIRHVPSTDEATRPMRGSAGNWYVALAAKTCRWSKLESAHSPAPSVVEGPVSLKMLRTSCGTFASASVGPGFEASSFEIDNV